jgi:hypothetical protein
VRRLALTEVVWSAAAVLLIAFSQLPRVGGKAKQSEYDGDAERARVTRPVAHEPSTVEHERARERPARRSDVDSPPRRTGRGPKVRAEELSAGDGFRTHGTHDDPPCPNEQPHDRRSQLDD